MLYKGIKYACGTCIKGHRSSQCTHAERPLFEIRKKGRPVTQCSLCRDLRKTKQVHIKCACTHKSTKASAVVPDIRDKCTCHDHHLPTITTTTPQDDAAGCATHHSNAVAGGDESYSSLLSSPPSGTMIQQQEQQQQPSSVLVDANIDWAFVTIPQESTLLSSEDTCATSDLGFLFHKPSSRRFFDGQPQSPRKKSVKKQQPQQQQQQQQPITTTCATTTTDTMLPFMDTSLSSSTSSTSSSRTEGNDMFSADVALLLDQVLQHHHVADNQDLGTNLEVTHTTTTTSNNNNNNNGSWITPTNIDTTAAAPSTHYLISDYCGMHPGGGVCRSKHTASGPGESVLITITPIITSTTFNSSSDCQGKVRTRMATCYCSGDCCHCPGCLVHPGVDTATWYNPLALSNSSTTSSTYSTSDDEDHHQQQQQQQQQSALLLG